MRSLERIVALLPWCSSVCCGPVCLGWACIVIIWCTSSRIWVYGCTVQCSVHFGTKACPPSRLFPVSLGREVKYGCANWTWYLKNGWRFKLLMSASRKSYMPRRLARQRMTFNDFEWPFHASRAISVVAELLVVVAVIIIIITIICLIRLKWQ